ncbi:MAG: type VI secretion system tip protein VgrG [Deltaproteobacteria bacterium]|nr:type VI secretion system tip protein VgrG [Deltaproteobacteria bacterium]
MPHPLVHQLEVAGFGFQVRDVVGVEALSTPWRLDLAFALDPQTMRGEPEAFDPDRIVKADAVLVMRRGDATVRHLTGIVTEVELAASASGHPEVTLTLEPRLALLRHRRDVRSHRNLSVPEIVREVVEALGVKVETRLRESYAKRPYSVQWRESDLAYVSRLLEDEGIFYFFRADDTLVLGDHPSAYEPSGLALPFRDAAGLNLNEDAVHAFGERAAVTPGKVTLRDWNTEHPDLDMDVSHPTAVDFGPEWYDFPGEYEEPDDGKRKARLHAEAFDRAAAALVGRSTAAGLAPGRTFVLDEAPLGVEPGELVVRSVRHEWHRDTTGFEVAFEADRGDVTFRPPRVTYVPRIMNPLTGIVCTNGEDIHCDHFGRVKVHFHWDRLRPYDDDCSHWIPVLQDNTGGSSAIPRKDWEVLVHFLEGDPDRPVVLGRVYNGDDVFPEKLPHAKDRSALTSLESPGRKTGNGIRFEDAAGLERLFVRAPKDMNVFVGNDQRQSVGNAATSVVENDETVSVGGDSTWKIGENHTPSIGANQSWSVGGNRTKKVGLGDANSIGGDHHLEIGADHELKVFSDVNYAADELKETIGGQLLEEFKEKHTTQVGGAMEFTIEGELTQRAKGSKSEQTTRNRTEKITGSHAITAETELQLRCFTERKTTVKGSLEARSGRLLALTGAEEHRQLSRTGTWEATDDLTLVVSDGTGQESSVVMSKGTITLRTTGDVTIEATSSAAQGASKSSQI